MKEHKYTKYRPEWCEHPDFESIGYCWGLAVHADNGTLDEFFETMTLIQTLKIEPFPVVLYGSEYWSGLIDWLRLEIAPSSQIAASVCHLWSTGMLVRKAVP